LTVNSGDITTLTRSFTPIDYFTDEEINFNLGSNYGAFVTTVSTIEDPGEEEDDEGDGSAGITRTGTNITTSNDTGTEEENDTITPPPAPPTTPPVTPPTNVTGAEVQAILDTVSTELSQATIDGKDITAAQNKYYEAQAAFSRGDYALAKQLANEALSLVRAATKPTTKPPSGTPQANATTNASGTPSTGQGKSDNMLLLGGIVLIVVLVGLVVAYFMLKKGGSSGNDKSYARKK
jgi:LPXTG-motif cell wall-anchored protein